ncbi:MAG: ATP synthase F1 subunit delta [Candidatus Dormibacteria bacterium]
MPDTPLPPRIPSTARHYAKALVELAEEEGSYSRWGERLELLVRLAQETDLGRALASPEYSTQQRRELATAVLSRVEGADLLARNLLLLLIASRRTRMLAQIRAAYLDLVERRQGRVSATVTTAVPLTSEQLERFGRELSQRAGREVKIASRVEGDLLGGAVVRVGDRVFDASLRTRLQQLRSRMLTEAGAI